MDKKAFKVILGVFSIPLFFYKFQELRDRKKRLPYYRNLTMDHPKTDAAATLHKRTHLLYFIGRSDIDLSTFPP